MNFNQISSTQQSSSEGVKQALTVCAAIAEIIGLAIYLASLISLNSLLIFAIAVLVIIFTVAVYWLTRSVFFKRVSVGLIVVVLTISVAVAVIAWSWLSGIGLQPIEVTISNSLDGDNVSMRYLVQGSVNNPHSKVHVIIHPLTVPEMWVQNPPIVSADGSWQTNVYFGTSTLGIGDKYEVVAIATGENFLITLATGNYLREGQTIKTLPRNTNQSNVVTVYRPE